MVERKWSVLNIDFPRNNLIIEFSERFKNTFFKSNFSLINRITSLMTYDYYDWASKYVHLFISYTAAL